MERARCLPQINAIKFLGNPAGKMFERQTKATLEVKTRRFCHDIRRAKTTILPVNKILMSFFAWNSFHLLRNLFLRSYIPCSVHFVGNRLLKNDILRLAILIYDSS